MVGRRAISLRSGHFLAAFLSLPKVFDPLHRRKFLVSVSKVFAEWSEADRQTGDQISHKSSGDLCSAVHAWNSNCQMAHCVSYVFSCRQKAQ